MHKRKNINWLLLVLILLLTSGDTILGDDLGYSDFKVGDTWVYHLYHWEWVDIHYDKTIIGERKCILQSKDTNNTNETVFITHQTDSGTLYHPPAFPTGYLHSDSIETVFKDTGDTVSFAPNFSFIKNSSTSITRNIVKYKNDTLFMDIYKNNNNDSLAFLESYGTLKYHHTAGLVHDTLLLLSFNNEAFEYDSIIPIQNNVYIGNFTIMPDKKSCYPKITTFNDLIHLNNKGIFEYIHIYNINGRRILNNSQIPDINRIATGNYIIHLKVPNKKPTSYKTSNLKSQITNNK